MPDVLMPRLSDTMEEGLLSQWVARVGDQVRKGDVLAVIETDKAAMDMEAYDEGVLSRILVAEGASVPIGTPSPSSARRPPRRRRCPPLIRPNEWRFLPRHPYVPSGRHPRGGCLPPAGP